MPRLKMVAIGLLKAVSLGASLFLYFVTFCVASFVPKGDSPEPLWDFHKLFGISLVVTLLTVTLFWKTWPDTTRDALRRRWRGLIN